MLRLAGSIAIALAACGCSAETLDAGSTSLPPKPATRATMSKMIDAFTMDATDLYFTCEDGWVYRLAKAGSSAPVRIAPAGAPGSLYTKGIAVDDDDVYWTAFGDGLDGGAVYRAPKSGGSAVLLAGSEPLPASIAVDGASVVWAAEGASIPIDGGGGIGKGTIQRIAKSGRGGVDVLAGGLHGPDFLTLDDEGGVFWHEVQAIRRLAPDGSTTPILERAAPFKSTNLVFAGGRVAWADAPAGRGSVWSADAGGDVTALASDVATPASVASSGSTIFWNVQTGRDVGAIDAASTGTDSVQTILTRDAFGNEQNEQAVLLLADDHAFYWVEFWESRDLTVAIRVLAR